MNLVQVARNASGFPRHAPELPMSECARSAISGAGQETQPNALQHTLERNGMSGRFEDSLDCRSDDDSDATLKSTMGAIASNALWRGAYHHSTQPRGANDATGAGQSPRHAHSNTGCAAGSLSSADMHVGRSASDAASFNRYAGYCATALCGAAEPMAPSASLGSNLRVPCTSRASTQISGSAEANGAGAADSADVVAEDIAASGGGTRRTAQGTGIEVDFVTALQAAAQWIPWSEQQLERAQRMRTSPAAPDAHSAAPPAAGATQVAVSAVEDRGSN